MKSPTTPKNLSASAALILAPLAFPFASHAQTNGIWIGATGGDWTDTANWDSGQVAGGAGSIVTMDADLGGDTINVDGAITIGQIDGGPTSGGFITGNSTPLTLTGDTITFDNNGSNARLDIAGAGVNSPTIPTGVALIENNLVLNDTLQITTGNRGETGNNSIAPTEISGDISGSGQLVKLAGNGAIILSGTNNYTGGTLIQTSSVNFRGTDTAARYGTGKITLDSAFSGNSAEFRTLDSVASTNGATITFANAFEYQTSRNAYIRSNVGTTVEFTSNDISSTAQTFTNNNGTDGALQLDGIGSGTVTIKFSGTGFTFSERLRFTNTSASRNVVFEHANTSGTQTWSGIIDDKAGTPGGRTIRRTGAGGTTVLSGNNTTAAEIQVDAGTMLINGISGSGDVTVAAGATLGGTGTIGDGGAADGAVNVTISGTLAPGSSPGQLTLDLGTGTLDVSGAEDLFFELGANNTTDSDSILLTSGTLELGTVNFSDFSFSSIVGFAPGTYTLFDTNSEISGSIGTATGQIDGLDATLSFANGDEDLILTVVPETNAYALIAGLLSLTWITLRRRR